MLPSKNTHFTHLLSLLITQFKQKFYFKTILHSFPAKKKKKIQYTRFPLSYQTTPIPPKKQKFSGLFLASETSNNGYILELFPVEIKRKLFVSLVEQQEQIVKIDCSSMKINEEHSNFICGAKVLLSEQQIYIQVPKLGNHVLTHSRDAKESKAPHVDIFAPYRRLNIKWKEIELYWKNIFQNNFSL